jgi:hypothetical protein
VYGYQFGSKRNDIGAMLDEAQGLIGGGEF